MAYGLSTRMFLENSAPERSAPLPSTAANYARAWSSLKPEERFAVVSGALKKAA